MGARGDEWPIVERIAYEEKGRNVELGIAESDPFGRWVWVTLDGRGLGWIGSIEAARKWARERINEGKSK